LRRGEHRLEAPRHDNRGWPMDRIVMATTAPLMATLIVLGRDPERSGWRP
jgi:hypothetical protein